MFWRNPRLGRIDMRTAETVCVRKTKRIVVCSAGLERRSSRHLDLNISEAREEVRAPTISSDVQKSKNLGRVAKFPKIRYDYQSADLDHLYYAGVVTHSLDFRKSSGGFIHGFRYTAQALHRILEHRYHERSWPSTLVPWSGLTNYLIKRMNEADGIYQMFGQLVDVILIDRLL